MEIYPNKKEDNYIDELRDWQDHQYTPGYFVGGRIPVWLKYPGKSRLLGLLYLIPGLFGLGLLIYQFITGTLIQSQNDWFQLPVPLLLIILSILFGIKQLRKKN